MDTRARREKRGGMRFGDHPVFHAGFIKEWALEALVHLAVERAERETARVREIDAYCPCFSGGKPCLAFPFVRLVTQNIHGGKEACFQVHRTSMKMLRCESGLRQFPKRQAGLSG